MVACWHPEQGRLGPVHHHQALGALVLHRVVHVHDVGGPLEDRAHLAGDGDLALVVQAVDLRHQRGQHRRPGRDLHDLGVAVVRAGDLLQGGAQRPGDGVALAVAIVLVHQIDLDVPQVGPLAQVVLAHQAVEVDGCGGAGIGLVVGDLR